MKKGIIILIIILLVLLAIFFFNSKKTEAPSEETVQTENIDVTEIEQGNYSIDTENSFIRWTGKKKILTNWIDEGTLKVNENKIVIESTDLKINPFTFDMNTISANKTGSGKGEDMLSNHLKSADFFDVEKYPTSTFTPTNIKKTQNNKVEVTGDLKIKDKTNEVNVVLDITKTTENSYKVTGSTTIDRTLWDVKFGSEKFFSGLGDNVIEDNVDIYIELIIKKDE